MQQQQKGSGKVEKDKISNNPLETNSLSDLEFIMQQAMINY